MKKIENTFVVTGFVGNNAEIRQFTNASVARFSLAVSRQEKNGEETNRVSAFMNMEAWRKNEHVDSFDKLQKGTMLTVEGYFKPDEWVDQQGTKHNRIVFIANKFYPTPDKEETPTVEPEKDFFILSNKQSGFGRFCFAHTTMFTFIATISKFTLITACVLLL